MGPYQETLQEWYCWSGQCRYGLQRAAIIPATPQLTSTAGKSTLFQAITKCSLGNPANFPFATIDPEESRVIVPDERYDWLCEKYNPKSRVPANLTITDIAGLTRGASTGAGLGNAFLSHIRAVDAIFQVVRAFDDAEIIHVEGDVDPTRDLDIISEELRIKDIEFTEKALEAQKKLTRRGGQSLEMKKLKEEEAIQEKVLALLQGGGDVRKGNWTPREVCDRLHIMSIQDHYNDDNGSRDPITPARRIVLQDKYETEKRNTF